MDHWMHGSRDPEIQRIQWIKGSRGNQNALGHSTSCLEGTVADVHIYIYNSFVCVSLFCVVLFVRRLVVCLCMFSCSLHAGRRCTGGGLRPP